MDNIVQNIRTEFAEVRAARPPAQIPAAVVIGAGKTWPVHRRRRFRVARCRSNISKSGSSAHHKVVTIVSKHLRHMVHQNDPA